MKKIENTLQKVPTGIQGFDEISGGGLPQGRPTLVCGGAGCGKTLFATEFLIRGAMQYDEPGVFMAFEETAEELTKNVASLGFNLTDLVKKKKLFIDYVHIERSEIHETGEYDLEGLFVRLNYAIDSIRAKRVVLDTVESLFGGLPHPMILRAELRRLFRWLKTKGVTAIITGERSGDLLTREGIEEFVSDCVISLDHRVAEQVSTRRMRIVKYRGTTHGTNEYPFLIDEDGITVFPITSAGLIHSASKERVRTGIPRLDKMLGGKGFYRGSSILVSGTAGTGKSSLAAHFANAACARGERVLYCAFEESQAQILRNMRSIGLNLEQWTRKDLLRFQATRPTRFGLENHLTQIHKAVSSFKPSVVIVDPISSLVVGNNDIEVKAMLVRLVDFFKLHFITSFFTSLTGGDDALEHTNVAISSLIDSWILLRDIELGGERNRGMYVLKSRGMAHSNQIREFVLTPHGIELKDVYVGSEGVLTGSARLAREAQKQAEQVAQREEMERKKLELLRKRKVLEAQIAALHAEYEMAEKETHRLISHEKEYENILMKERSALRKSKQAD
ncbi:MAG: circadian clock protein KaiC [Bacteroidota bacterium]